MARKPHEERVRQRRLRDTERRGVSQPMRPDVPVFRSSWVPVILRSIDVDAGEMYVQRVRYADDTPVVGSYEAFGEPFQAYPLVGAVYEDYELWVWPLVGELENEVLTTEFVPLLAYYERGRWQVMVAFKVCGSLLPEDEPVNECSFG